MKNIKTQNDNTLKAACAEAGLRLTPQRSEIYHEVSKTEEHPDVATIFKRVRKRLPSISLDTVYRTLTSLEEIGIIRRIDPIYGKARYDANVRDHHHFICTECRSISDFYLNKKQPLPQPENLHQFGTPQSLHLQIRGICNNCKK